MPIEPNRVCGEKRMNNREQLIEKAEQKWTSTEEVILKRRSVRLYKKEQVPEFMVRRLLEAGRFAPSAGNGQPWKFVVLRDPEIIAGVSETTVKICKFFKSLIDYRIPGKRWRLPIAKFSIKFKSAELHPVPFGAITLIADGKLGLYHGAPTVIMIFKDVRGISNPDLDCGIAGQNMVLAAHSMGLGTCWVSFAKLAFQYTGKWKKRLGITYPYKFITSLAIGWPVGEPDGIIARPTHDVDWYENGIKTVVH
jgi:nitroreductase